MKNHYKKDQTAFKLVVYYSHRSNGTAYNINEITLKEHRKYHDSIDFIPIINGWQTRHDLAYSKLLNHLKKHRDKIFSALLFANNHKKKKQYLIGKFNRSNDFDIHILPQFTKDEKTGNVFITGLHQPALETYDLK